ncbi:MAG TPA: hypothetical protein VHD37_03020 [Candidatus Paceibacterota bacterium]|nr:hypothetical protein [Candidatus Paceibacterota bacterium]
MAETAATAHAAEAKKSKRFSSRTILLTLGLSAFMLALPFTGSSAFALEMQYRLAMVVWVPLLLYLGFQQYATANRSFTDLQGSVFDNFSAIGTIIAAALVIGAVAVLGFVRHEFVLNGYQVLLELACFSFGTYDYFFGSLFSQAIAGSTKGRQEE